MQVVKTLMTFHEPVFENWKSFSRAFFTRKNPYTGRALAEEPALPLVSLVNEAMFYAGPINARAPGKIAPVIAHAWAEWLAAARKSDPGCWPGLDTDTMPAGFKHPAVIKFAADLEARAVRRMRDFLRDELGMRALLTNENCGPHYESLQHVKAALYDYVDDHFYIDHPEFLFSEWSLPSRSGNNNPLRTPRRTCLTDMARRVISTSPAIRSARQPTARASVSSCAVIWNRCRTPSRWN